MKKITLHSLSHCSPKLSVPCLLSILLATKEIPCWIQQYLKIYKLTGDSYPVNNNLISITRARHGHIH